MACPVTSASVSASLGEFASKNIKALGHATAATTAPVLTLSKVSARRAVVLRSKPFTSDTKQGHVLLTLDDTNTEARATPPAAPNMGRSVLGCSSYGVDAS